MIPDFAEQIKQRIDMSDICAMYGISVNKQGFTRCLWHDERTPSMKIYKDGCKCFGCGVHASSVIDFAMLYFNISFREACSRLNSDFNLGLKMDKELSSDELRSARKASYQRKKERAAHEETHKKLQRNYYEALERWEELSRMKSDNAPEDPFSDIPDAYIVACAELPAASYALDIASENLRVFEEDRYAKKGGHTA